MLDFSFSFFFFFFLNNSFYFFISLFSQEQIEKHIIMRMLVFSIQAKGDYNLLVNEVLILRFLVCVGILQPSLESLF